MKPIGASPPVPPPSTTGAISDSIVNVRGQPVLPDSVVAALYGVSTKRLNEQIKRNAGRFPGDFVFRLTAEEFGILNRSQIATGRQRHRDPRNLPLVFTEHGAIMAAAVLNTAQAVETSVFVVRAFVQLRRLASGNGELSVKLTDLERRLQPRLKGHDRAIAEILAAIRSLLAAPTPRHRPIGFTADLEQQTTIFRSSRTYNGIFKTPPWR